MKKIKSVLLILLILISLSSCRKYEIIHENTDFTTEIVSSAVSIPVENKDALSYVANKNTMKFHYPECHSVERMKEKNKMHLNCTREEAIEDGYKLCKNCNP